MRDRFVLVPISIEEFKNDGARTTAFLVNLKDVISSEEDKLVFFEQGSAVPADVIADERSAEVLVRQGLAVLKRTDLTATQKLAMVKEAVCS